MTGPLCLRWEVTYVGDVSLWLVLSLLLLSMMSLLLFSWFCCFFLNFYLKASKAESIHKAQNLSCDVTARDSCHRNTWRLQIFLA